MNLIPFLHPFYHFGVIFAKFLAEFMKLAEEPSPSPNDSFVFHPSELKEGQRITEGPFKHCDDKVADNDEVFLGGLSERRNRRAKVINSSIN
jgi:hypothetical protein